MRKLYFYLMYFIPTLVFAAEENCQGIICNPLSGVQTGSGAQVETIPQMLDMLLGIMIQIMLPLVAILIIYTGYKFATAKGAPAELQKAKDMLTYILVGLGILLASKGIQMAIQSTIESLK